MLYSATRLTMATLQSFLKLHASLQSSHVGKLNTVAWVVELTYLHLVVKFESLLGGHGKARCTIIREVSFKGARSSYFR